MAARLDGEGNGHKGPKSVCPQDGRAIVKVKPWLILLFLKHYRREIIVYMYINFRRKKKINSFYNTSYATRHLHLRRKLTLIVAAVTFIV